MFGDVVELSVGDRVPADLRIIQIKTATLRVEQASLTGESDAVHKSADTIVDANSDLQSKECMLFSGEASRERTTSSNLLPVGTAIATGHCVGVVTATGMQTEIGKIQDQIIKAAEEEEDTPLKQKINRFGELLAQVNLPHCMSHRGTCAV